MAELHTRRSLCHNPPSGGEDELAGGPPGAPTKGCNSLTYFPAVFWAPTPAPPSIDKLFKQFMKAYLESNQGPSQPLEKCERPLKAKIPDVY